MTGVIVDELQKMVASTLAKHLAGSIEPSHPQRMLGRDPACRVERSGAAGR